MLVGKGPAVLLEPALQRAENALERIRRFLTPVAFHVAGLARGDPRYCLGGLALRSQDSALQLGVVGVLEDLAGFGVFFGGLIPDRTRVFLRQLLLLANQLSLLRRLVSVDRGIRDVADRFRQRIERLHLRRRHVRRCIARHAGAPG